LKKQNVGFRVVSAIKKKPHFETLAATTDEIELVIVDGVVIILVAPPTPRNVLHLEMIRFGRVHVDVGAEEVVQSANIVGVGDVVAAVDGANSAVHVIAT